MKCNQCGKTLFKKDITEQEQEISYFCRGGVYEELSDVPCDWREEAQRTEIIISTTYTCSHCDCESVV